METGTETKSNCCATFIVHHRLGLLQEERFFNGLYFGLRNCESILHGNEPYWGIVYLQGPGIMIFDYSFGRRKKTADLIKLKATEVTANCHKLVQLLNKITNRAKIIYKQKNFRLWKSKEN